MGTTQNEIVTESPVGENLVVNQSAEVAVNVKSQDQNDKGKDSVNTEKLVVMNMRELKPVTKHNQQDETTDSNDEEGSFEETTEVTSENAEDLSEDNEIFSDDSRSSKVSQSTKASQVEEVKIQITTESESNQEGNEKSRGVKSINSEGTSD